MADFAIRLLDPSSVAEPDWTIFWMGFECLKKFRPSWHGWLCPSTLIVWQLSIPEKYVIYYMRLHTQYTIIIPYNCWLHETSSTPLISWHPSVLCCSRSSINSSGLFLSPIFHLGLPIEVIRTQKHSEQSREECPQEPIRDTGYWLAETQRSIRHSNIYI